MKTVRLNLKKIRDDSYTIFIGPGIFPDRLNGIVSALRPTRTAVILDSNILRLYGTRIRKILKDHDPVLFPFPAGERNKNASQSLRLFMAVLQKKLDRRSLIVAVGGGVTGDLAGFVSSIYLRGIPFVQVPTSLLAMADSSIGGKTGVDMPSGKNLMGTFHQPAAVIIDPSFLKTLPESEYRNGLSEIVKHAVILDRSLFRVLDRNQTGILSREESLLTDVMERSCRIKADIVRRDERESGLRQILNFGHTVGHAVEQASSYRIPHGFAVALGMVAEGWIAVRSGLLQENDWALLAGLCGRLGLLRFASLLRRISPVKILSAAAADKKNTGREIRCVLLEGIGRIHRTQGDYSFPVSGDDIRTALEKTGSFSGIGK